MSAQKQNEPTINEGKSILQNERVRKVTSIRCRFAFCFPDRTGSYVDNVSGPGS